MPGAIDITIKTLDGNSRKFENISDELTVKQFKEKIASKVSIAAGQQRLIYAGKVLNDNNKLSEYGLDGHTIHLVERPNTTGPNPAPPRPNPPNVRPHHHHHARPGVRVNGNPFRTTIRVGPMPRRATAPTNHPGVGGFPSPLPGRPATTPIDAGTNRVEHCRRFLDNARHVIFHLRQLKTALETSGESGHQNTSQQSAGSSTERTAPSSDSQLPNGTNQNDQNDSQDSSTPNSSAPTQSVNGQSANDNTPRPISRAFPASEITTLHRAAMDVHNELAEYIAICDQVINDPSHASNPQRRRLHEKMIHGVGEATHFLAHAQHSLSDLFCDLSQNPCLALAVPTPMNATVTGFVRADIGIGGPGQQPQVIRFPMAPTQFVDPFVPPHQRPSANAAHAPTGEATSGQTTGAPQQQAEPSESAMDTDSIPAATTPNQESNPPPAASTPTDANAASAEPPNTGLPNHVPAAPQANGPQPGPRAVHPRPVMMHKDPYVPCSSRFFQSRPANAQNRVPPSSRSAQNTAASNTDSTPNNVEGTDSNNDTDAAGINAALNNVLPGPAFSVEVNENVMAVDPSRPLGEQLTELINSALPSAFNQGGLLFQDMTFDMQPPSQENGNGQNSEEHDDNVDGAENLRNFQSTLLQSSRAAQSAAQYLYGDFQRAMGEATGANNDSSQGRRSGSLYDILQTMQAHDNIPDDAPGVINDTLTAFSRGVTFSDLFVLLSGDPTPLRHARPELINYMNSSILRNQPYSRERVSERVDEILRENRADITTHFNSVLYRDSIDGPGTAVALFRHHANEICNIILDASIDINAFPQQLYSAFKRLVYEFLTLFNNITSPAGMVDRLFTTAMISDFLGPSQAYGQMVSGMMSHQVAALASNSNSVVPFSEVENYIAKLGDSSPGQNASQQAQNDSPANSETLVPSDSNSVEETSEPMETDQAPPEAAAVRPKVRPTQAGDAPASEAPSLFNPEQIASVTESWREIIERDVKAQQSAPPARPYFSDAYLIGMPARFRQGVTAGHNIGMPGSMTNIVTRSIGSIQGVDTTEVTQAINSDPELIRLYRQSVQEDVRQRVAEEPALFQDKPSTKTWLEKP